MKTIKQLEQELEHWDNLIATWNDKKLDNGVRQKAEDEVHKITDEGGGELVLDPLLKQTIAIKEMIEERIKYCESKLKGDFEKNIVSGQEFKENKIWDWRISGFKEILSKINGGEE